MPIITTAAPPAPPVVVPEVGYASVTYWDPSGNPWPMTDTSRGYFALADGVSGLGAAPVELTTDPHPRGGARLRHVQPQPRLIVWPLHVEGSDHQEFTDRWRALARAFTDTLRLGPGVLDIARPDGTRRQIEVVYQEGFDGLGQFGTGVTWDRAVITLWCPDPYWVDPVPVGVHRGYDAGAAEDFLQPFPSVSSGQVLGATVLTNPGDVLVWPTWVISGPASLITFTRADTGEEFVLNPSASAIGHGNLLAGQQVTVTTDPPTVRYQDGSNWIGGLNWPDASLWALPPGESHVTFQLDGSGAGSAVDLSFNPRYETA